MTRFTTTSLLTTRWKPALAGGAAPGRGSPAHHGMGHGRRLGGGAPKPALRFDEASVQFVANRTDNDGESLLVHHLRKTHG